MKPLISLIIPVYNAEKFIKRCLDSIINQSFIDFEVIVVNDATPDKAMDIVAEYARSDSRFVIVDKKQNEGSMKARESGYKRAQGDYIVFCDPDDYLDVKCLEVLYKVIVQQNADMAVSGYCYVDFMGNVTLRKVYTLPFGNNRMGVYQALLTNTIPHTLWGNIYKRELFTNYSYSCFMNQTHGEDFILFYELVNHVDKVVTTDIPLYYYCQNLNSATQTRLSDEALKKRLFIDNYWLEYMLSLNIDNDLVYSKAFNNLYDRLLWGYNRTIVIEGSTTLMEAFSIKKVVHSLGIWKGTYLYLLCRYRFLYCLPWLYYKSLLKKWKTIFENSYLW